MGRSERASLGSRGLAAIFGVVCVVAVSLPAALSNVTADDQSSLGAGLYPAAYAITGAKVVAAPGKIYEPGTIVVRRGVIEAVGLAKDVAVPYDAETIDGKGLVVYPGFIDLHTTVGQRQAPNGRRPAREGPSIWPRRPWRRLHLIIAAG